MSGGKLQLVEKRGNVELYRYGSALFGAWAVFIYKPDKDGDWKCVKNGKWPDVWSKYRELTA